MANRDRGQSGGFYATLAELTSNVGRFISEGDLLFIASNGNSYQATTVVNGSPISGTSPQLYAHLRSGSAASFLEPNWDFEVVFNDGVELRSGYGTRNSHGNKAVDFSRASESGNINKSGVVETVGVDEPRIGSDGVFLGGEYTNLIKYSEDLSQWAGGNATQSFESGDIGFSQINKITATNTVESSKRTGITVSNNISSYVLSAIVKKGTSSTARLNVANGALQVAGVNSTAEFNFDTEQIAQTYSPPNADGFCGFEDIGNGYYKIWVGAKNCSGVIADAQNVDIGMRSPSVGDTILVAAAQFTETSVPVPYIKTESTPVTSSPDIATVPMMGNMPASGKPFTIEVDCAIPEGPALEYTCFRSGNPTDGMTLRRVASSNVRFDLSNGTNFVSTATPVDGAKHRFILTYDGGVSISVDGEIKATSASSFTASLSNLVDLYIGSNQAGQLQLNAPIKAFRILHRALTAEQIAARGGYNGE